MGISINSKSFSVFGDKAAVVADMAFSGTYSFGGFAIDHDQQFGLHDIEIALVEGKSGHFFEHDVANKKIKVLRQAPPIVYEEKHTVTDDVITTKYPAAFITNIAISGQNKVLRSTGIALASLSDNQCCLVEQMAAGEQTQIRVKDWDRLAGDGAFTGGTTNWSFSDSLNDWTYGTNNVAKDQDGVETITHDNFAPVAGRTYRLTYTISSWTVGTVTPTLGGTAGTAVGADGTYSEEITAATTDALVFTPSNTSRFTLDSVTVYDLSEPVYVTYITQAWKDVWDNLVQDETKTLATGANTLTSGNKILACMYIDQTTATAAALTMIDEDDTAASGEIDLALNVATAQFTAHSAQNAKAVKTTYIKVPDSGFLVDRLVTNETATGAGGDPYTSTFDYPILIWGYTGQVPVNTAATLRLIDYAGTPATGEAVIDWFGLGARGAAGPAVGTQIGTKDNATATGAYVWGKIDEIQTVPLEIPDGETISLSSVKGLFIGL